MVNLHDAPDLWGSAVHRRVRGQGRDLQALAVPAPQACYAAAPHPSAQFPAQLVSAQRAVTISAVPSRRCLAARAAASELLSASGASASGAADTGAATKGTQPGAEHAAKPNNGDDKRIQASSDHVGQGHVDMTLLPVALCRTITLDPQVRSSSLTPQCPLLPQARVLARLNWHKSF